MASQASSVTMDWESSPRVATIGGGLTTITVQDLHDTLKDIEDDPVHMAYANLVDSAGKEDLGGGVTVGITLTLQNCRVAFEAQGGPSYEARTVTNGNLVAVDANGDAMDPIHPTAFTQVTVAQSTSASIIDPATLDQLVETGYTLKQAVRIILSALAGKVSGGPGSPVFRDINDTKDRITATADSSGNRTVVTTDGS